MNLDVYKNIKYKYAVERRTGDRVKFKLSIVIALAFVVCFSALSNRDKAEAHPQDYFAGTYVSSAPCNQKNLKFRVRESAVNSLLTSSLYTQTVVGWNNTHCSSNCNHIKVSVIVCPDTIPEMAGYCDIRGENLSENGEIIQGKMIAYNSSGSIVNATANWHHVEIRMNTVVSVYDSSNRTTHAKKTLLHEVGHALKLDHPIMGTTMIEHNCEGYPAAVMNTGAPGFRGSRATIQQHDKDNLVAKWGYQ